MSRTLLRRIFCILFSAICGVVFIISAATKLMPVEPFEISLVDIGLVNWELAPVAARLLIGMEFITGFLLLFLFRLRKFTVPFAFFIVCIFTIYLLFVIQTYGNKGSCGCFGDVILITPLEGIIKNLFLLFGLAASFKLADDYNFRFKKWIALVIALALAALPFILNPVGLPFSKKEPKDFNHFALDFSPMSGELSEMEAKDLKKGKHVVAFLSAVCPHCRIAAKKLAVMKKLNPSLPLIFILYNNKEKLQDFYDDTKSESIPHLLMNNKENFLVITGHRFPRIYWMNDSIVEYESNHFDLNQRDIENWLIEKSPDTLHQ